MEDYSANLLETITYFYTKAAQENKFKETEKKLIEFTRCEEAWEGCFFMLNQPDLNDYQMIFAANTLKSKMMFEFDNFKNNHPEEAARFGEEIIKMIKEFINNRSTRPNGVVINSLCLSLAFFSIHQDTLPDIDSELCSNVDEVGAMFNVLRYLSEETFFNRIVVKEEVVNSFFRKLREFSPNVFRLINKWAEIILNPNSEEIQQIDSNRISKLKSSIVEAIFSWILMEIKEEHFQIISQEGEYLIRILFDELQQEGDSASNASSGLGEIMTLCKRFKQEDLKKFLFESMDLLLPKFQELCEIEDLQSIENYTEMFLDFADSEIESGIRGQHSQLLNAIIIAFGFEGKHFSQCGKFFGYFFNYIRDNFMEEEREALLPQIKSTLEQLFACIVKKTIMKENEFLEMNDKNDRHVDFVELFENRDRIGHLLKRIAQGIGYQEMYKMQIQQLHDTMTNGNLEDLSTLREIENLLFCLSYSIQLFENFQEVQNVNMLMSDLLQTDLPKATAIRRAILDIIHIISEFMKEMDDETLQTYVRFIMDGFNDQLTLEVSSQGFSNMILKNLERFGPYLDQFLDPANITELSKVIVSYNPRWGKIFTAILTLSCSVYGNTPDKFRESLVQVLSPFFTILTQESIGAGEATIGFEYIADVFRVINDEKRSYGMIKAPSREVLIEIFPTVLGLIETFHQQEKPIEASSRVIKHSLRAGNDHSDALDELIQTYVEKITELFTRYPCSWLIYPISILVPIFGARVNFRELFCNVKEHLLSKVFEHFSSEEVIKADPLLAADLFNMMRKYLQENPDSIFGAGSFKNLMEFTILCCQIEHPELSRQLADFQIDIFIKLKRIQQQELVLACSEQEMIQIAEFAFEKGAIIFEKYIEAITKVPLEATTDNMVDFMTEIVIYFPEQSVQWINSCLVNVPHNILSEDEKKDFCVDFEYGPDSELNIHRSFKILMKRSKQATLQKID